ncbi:hypothetical protein UlMin_029093 [Ulmus minor]
MVHKRHFRDDEEDDRFPPRNRDSKKKTMFNKTLFGDLTKDFLLNEASWERFLRPVIRDAAERAVYAFYTCSRCPASQAGTSAVRGLQLRFLNKLPNTIFTGSKIESEESRAIKIALVDAASETTVCSGPLSSIKIEIVALNGDFGADDQEDWTATEFNASVVRERQGKRPLVTGVTTLMLREGVGEVGEIIFTDNSSWIRSRKFRLGARVMQKGIGEERIREARSEPFMVKDHRGESYRKHHPPRLDDEVWRLEKIAKEGAFHTKLSSNRINTVKDFLQKYMIDPHSLRTMFGGISDRVWKFIVEHALECEDVNDYKYAYFGQDVIVHFNSVYKVVGATFGDQYFRVEDLLPIQKVMVENLKQQAYSDLNNLIRLDELSIPGFLRPPAILQPGGLLSDLPVDLQQNGFQFLQQGQPLIELGLSQSSASASTSYPYVGEGSNQIVGSLEQNYPVQAITSAHRNSISVEGFFSTQNNEESNLFSSLSQGQQLIPTTTHLTENFFNFQTPTFSPDTTTWGQGNGSFFASNNEPEDGILTPAFVHIARGRKSKVGWCKIRAAIKWWLSAKPAARRMARHVCFNRPWYLDS